MQFELLTLSGSKFSGEVSQVSLVTAEGATGILPHHEPLTAMALPGPVTIYERGRVTELFATFGGLLEVTADRVRLLADEAEAADDLIQSEIEAALAQAEQLRAGAKDKHELARAQELIDRHGIRLEVANLRRRHHPHSQAPKSPEE